VHDLESAMRPYPTWATGKPTGQTFAPARAMQTPQLVLHVVGAAAAQRRTFRPQVASGISGSLVLGAQAPPVAGIVTRRPFTALMAQAVVEEVSFAQVETLLVASAHVVVHAASVKSAPSAAPHVTSVGAPHAHVQWAEAASGSEWPS